MTLARERASLRIEPLWISTLFKLRLAAMMSGTALRLGSAHLFAEKLRFSGWLKRFSAALPTFRQAAQPQDKKTLTEKHSFSANRAASR
jgi:hypothetical protein